MASTSGWACAWVAALLLLALFASSNSVEAAETVSATCRLPGGVVVTPLAPDTDFLARSDRVDPTLYWYQSGRLPGGSQVAWKLTPNQGLGREGRIGRSGIPPRDGFGRIDFRRERVRLRPGRAYVWSLEITLADARVHRCGGQISVVPRHPPGGAAAEQANRLASSGHWYAAVMTLRQAMRFNPNGAGLRDGWQAILLQGGLAQVALVQ